MNNVKIIKMKKNKDAPINVLLVDDDPDVLDVTIILLEKMGYMVASAKKSSDAINHMKKYNDAVDVVLTDFFMPDMNGLELASLIKKQGNNKPVILISGGSELINKERVNESGIAAIVQKPFSGIELDTAIKQVLEGEKRNNYEQGIA